MVKGKKRGSHLNNFKFVSPQETSIVVQKSQTVQKSEFE